jgi:hypothetical protein
MSLWLKSFIKFHHSFIQNHLTNKGFLKFF